MAKMEYRNIDLENLRTSKDVEGEADAYLTAWGTVDSYKTSFQRGCFKRTFEERGHKIRHVWNHKTLIGQVLECREDDYGPFVKVKFNLDTRAGKDAWAHVRDKDVDSFSFGFNVIADDWETGIRTFTEIRVMECGPVVFEANGAATIVDVRAEDFGETVKINEVANRGWKLFYALENTIDDIYWGDDYDPESIISKVDTAISSFHGAYMSWLAEYYAQYKREDTQKYLTRTGNLIQEAIKNTEGLETIVRETAFTDSDFDRLKNGKLLTTESRAKLSELPESIRSAHQAERRNTVERLCAEIRESGFNDAEKQRFRALLGFEFEPEKVTEDDTLSFLDNLTQTL